MTFFAAFDGGPCGTCNERIREGDEVAYDRTNRLVHAVCPESIDLDEPLEACPRCFVVIPLSGVCGNC